MPPPFIRGFTHGLPSTLYSLDRVAGIIVIALGCASMLSVKYRMFPQARVYLLGVEYIHWCNMSSLAKVFNFEGDISSVYIWQESN